MFKKLRKLFERKPQLRTHIEDRSYCCEAPIKVRGKRTTCKQCNKVCYTVKRRVLYINKKTAKTVQLEYARF